jgi:hypothetical protein
MNPSHKLYWLIGGVVALLIVASVIGRILRAQVKDEKAAAVVDNLIARVRAWWWMVAVFAAAFLLGRNATIAMFAFISFFALREFLTLTPTKIGDHRALSKPRRQGLGFDDRGTRRRDGPDGFGQLRGADLLSRDPVFLYVNPRRRLRAGQTFSTSASIGSVRTRLPVAAKMALQRAGTTGGSAGSPSPVGGLSVMRNSTSTGGA